MAGTELFTPKKKREALLEGLYPLAPSGGRGGAWINRWLDRAWLVSALPMLLFFLVPIGLLFGRTTPAELLAGLGQPAVLQAVGVSLRTTLASLALIVVFGTPLAYLMGRHRFPGQRLVDALIDLPALLPPSVAGVALLVAFGRRGLVGGWLESYGLQVAFTPLAVILAQTFIAAPFFVRAAAIGFSGVDGEIEQAAQLDGASRWQVFRHVILPLSRFSLVTGGMLSWARALGEFGATIIFAGNFPGVTQTMPTAIYLGFEVDLDIALTLSVLLVAIAFVSLLVLKTLLAKREE